MFFPPSCFGFVASSWQKKGRGGTESFWEVIQFYHDRRAISRKAIMQVRKGEIEKKGNNKLERRRRLRLHEAQEKAGRKLFFNVGAKTFFSPSLSPSSPPPLPSSFHFLLKPEVPTYLPTMGLLPFFYCGAPPPPLSSVFSPSLQRGKLCEVLQTHIKLTYPGSQEAVKILLLLGKKTVRGWDGNEEGENNLSPRL